MAMREATQSQRFPLATARNLPREDWRFATLGLQPTADQELIERAYWYQERRLRPLAETDREAARKLALISEAYHALAPAAAEPWKRRAGHTAPPRAHGSGQLFDIVLTLALLAVLALGALVILNPDARIQFNAALQHAAVVIQHFRATTGH